ncbi:MAG TPA: hypothetical protein VFR09_03480 [Alphaproteobacteria bacterium]|nr:hypothetical protein [Alphaproteobacteria bacterium]
MLKWALVFLLIAFPALADDTPDNIGSTIRGSGSTVPGSLGSTLRAGTRSSSDLSSMNMNSSDPKLSTVMPDPKSSISSDNMKSSDPRLSTTMANPKSSIASSITGGSQTDAALCRALTKHTPSADTNYQPGTDVVNGKAVAPADVPGSPQMQLPSKIDIPLTLQLTKILNLNTSVAPFDKLGAGTEAQIGSLQVEGDKVSYNGQPLSDQQQDNLAVLCMKQGAK